MKRGLLILICILFASTAALSANPKVALLGFASDNNHADFVKYVHVLSRVIQNSLIKINQIQVIDTEQVTKEVTDALRKGRNLNSNLTILGIGRKLNANLVISGSIGLSIDKQNVIISAKILDINRKKFLEPIEVKDIIALQNILLGNFVNQLVSRINEYYKIKTEKGFTETAIVLDEKDRIALNRPVKTSKKTNEQPKVVKKAPIKQTGFSKDITFNTIFSFRKTLPLVGNEMANVFGIDFIFDVEGSEYGFGFALNIIQTDFLVFDLFFEFHALTNNYGNHWQFYLRTGPGLVYPLDPINSMDVKLTTMLGTRYALSYFIFDVGVGIEYFRSQTSAIFARAGAGFHF